MCGNTVGNDLKLLHTFTIETASQLHMSIKHSFRILYTIFEVRVSNCYILGGLRYEKAKKVLYSSARDTLANLSAKKFLQIRIAIKRIFNMCVTLLF